MVKDGVLHCPIVDPYNRTEITWPQLEHSTVCDDVVDDLGERVPDQGFVVVRDRIALCLAHLRSHVADIHLRRLGFLEGLVNSVNGKVWKDACVQASRSDYDQVGVRYGGDCGRVCCGVCGMLAFRSR